MQQRRRTLIFTISVVVLLALAFIGHFAGTRGFYPYLVFNAAQSFQIVVLKKAQASRTECEAMIARMTKALEGCAACTLAEARCVAELDARQRKILHGQPVDVPVMQIPDGAVAFVGAATELALFTCQEGVRQTSRLLTGTMECKSPSVENITLSLGKISNHSHIPLPAWSLILSIAAIPAGIAFVVCYLLIRSERLHQRFTHDHVDRGPQKFHAVPTPRIGGVAIAAALIGTILLAAALGWLRPAAGEGLYLLTLTAIPAFAGGLGEDITKRVGVLARLGFTIAAGVIAALLVDATLDRLDVPILDTLLQLEIFAIIFTAFAVGGVANAINIVDGYNGLVGGYSLIVLGAIGYVASQVGDPVVLNGSLVMAGALLGFLRWNYPKGRIFLGDGGAYLLGFWLAELCILLAVRNPEVSPWFPLILLAYPILETFYTIYRRTILRGISPGLADSMHLHQLIYRRLHQSKINSRDPEEITRRNSMVAKYVWVGTTVFIVPSLSLWDSTPALVGLAFTCCGIYLWLYILLVRHSDSNGLESSLG